MSGGDHEKLVIFNGSDFSFWKCQILDYLYSKELELPLDGKPEDMKEAEWKKLDRRVLGIIRLTLTKNVQSSVAKAATTAELMTALSNMYEKPSVNNKVYLATRYFNLKMAEDASVTAHINEFNLLMNKLAAVGLEFTDEVNAILLLRSLPDSWETMKAAISNSCGKEELQFSQVRDSAIAEEIRRKDSPSVASTSGSALNVDRGRSNNRSHGNRGKSRNNRSKSRNGRFECWNCGKFGHLKRDCRAPKKTEGSEAGANVVANETHDALVLAVESTHDTWVIDSGASFHTTGQRDILENYVAGNHGKVYLADGEPLDIIGIGDVKLKMANGSVWKIRKVRHVQNMMKNLISVGQLDSEGYEISFGQGNWKITKGAMIVARGSKSGTLYVNSNNKDMVAVVDQSSQTDLWHNRLGHMSEKGMKILHSVGKLHGLKGG